MAKRRTRPRIGVTGPDKGGWPSWICTRLLLWWHGGRAVRLCPRAPARIDGLDALIIGGGADIDPSRYGQEILHSLKQESRTVRQGRVLHFLVAVILWLLRRLMSMPVSVAHQDLRRDELEFSLLKQALQNSLPVLGICRGGQVINVHFGGALYQDIAQFYTETPNLHTIRARKRILIEGGTTLFRLIGRSETRVNSLHHQSVRTLGKDLRVAAKEPNGVIQAIEHVQLPFVLGVQWHPEFLPMYREQRRIFRQLVNAAKVHQLGASGSYAPTTEAASRAPASS